MAPPPRECVHVLVTPPVAFRMQVRKWRPKSSDARGRSPGRRMQTPPGGSRVQARKWRSHSPEPAEEPKGGAGGGHQEYNTLYRGLRVQGEDKGLPRRSAFERSLDAINQNLAQVNTSLGKPAVVVEPATGSAQ